MHKFTIGLTTPHPIAPITGLPSGHRILAKISSVKCY